MTILDRNSGVFNTTTAFNVTRSTGNYGTGTVIVVAVFANTTINTPGSATQRTISLLNLGLYSYDLAGAGQASIGFTNSTGCGIWYAWELSAGSTWLTGSASQNNSGASSYAVTVTPTLGSRHLLVSAGGVASGAVKSVTAFSNSFALFGANQVAAQDWPYAAGADLDVLADGVSGWGTTATFSTAAVTAAGGIVLAYADAGAAPSDPVGQQLLVQRQAVNRSYTY